MEYLDYCEEESFFCRKLLNADHQVQLPTQCGLLHNADIPTLYDDCGVVLGRILDQQRSSTSQNLTR